MELTQFDGRSAGAVFVPSDGRRLGTVLICHERYGLVQHTLDLACQLANAGYIAIAPDFVSDWDGDKDALVKGEATAHIEDATIIRHLSAALGYAVGNLDADPDRLAVIGACASGSYPFLAASVVPSLSGLVVMYGGAGDADVSDDRRPSYKEIFSNLTAPVLGIWGEDDHVASVDEVRRLRALLEDHHVSYEFHLFANMPHGWLNSTMSGRYRPQGAEKAWSIVLSFLERAFAGAFLPERVVWEFSSDIACDYDFATKVRLS